VAAEEVEALGGRFGGDELRGMIIVKPPALYRSPLFWLGMFVPVFLVWAWGDSMKKRTEFVRRVMFRDVGMPVEVSEDGVFVANGRIVLTWTSVTELLPPVTEFRRPYKYSRHSAVYDRTWFAKPAMLREHDEMWTWAKFIRQQVVIPMWLVMAVYLVLWDGVLRWYRRRWRRLAGDVSSGRWSVVGGR
jgi:hypothetical protein